MTLLFNLIIIISTIKRRKMKKNVIAQVQDRVGRELSHRLLKKILPFIIAIIIVIVIIALLMRV